VHRFNHTARCPPGRGPYHPAYRTVITGLCHCLPLLGGYAEGCRLPFRPFSPYPPAPEEDALRPRPLSRRLTATGLAVVTGLLTLSACKDSGPVSALGRIRQADRIMIATDALYPPNEFKQGGHIVGFDIDLGTAIARKLGVTAEFQDVEFDTIVQALQQGKYDMSLSSFTDTRERESRFDFVTYLSAGTTLLVRKGNPKRLRPDDLSLCGRRVAVEKGTTQEDELTRKDVTQPGAGARIDACGAGHRPAPIRMSFDGQAAATEALAKGHADAVLAGSPSAVYGASRSAGRFEVSGRPYDAALYGVAVPKGQTDLRDAVFKAVKDLMSDGTYARMTGKWGLSGGAVGEPRINAAR
jgi:polar amino acid transport system substrate-binding protein